MSETYEPLSANHWSHDLQVLDAVNWLDSEHHDIWDSIFGVSGEFSDYVELGEKMYELDNHWFVWDCQELDVDPEYLDWVTDALEGTGLIVWEEGEPWGIIND